MLEEWPVYSHGFSVRYRVADAARGRATYALRQRLRFGDGRQWTPKGERVCMRGSGWLTARRPGPRTVVGKLNRSERLALYNLAVVEREDGLYLDIEGVRRRDCTRLFEELLALGAEDYEVAYFRRRERYVVLSQPEAERLAASLGGKVSREHGRRARLVWLLENFQRDVMIRTRSKAVAHGKIYRVQPERGATAAYRLEVWLAGDRRGRSHFFEKDQAALDDVLAELVAEHDLHPIVRPIIWEGEGGRTPEFTACDPDLARMTMTAYRGSRPTGAKCHPPRAMDSAPRLVLGGPAVEIPDRLRVSCPVLASHPSRADHQAFSPGPSLHGERDVALEIANDPVSLLTEVVLDAHHDPTPLLRHLVHEQGGPGRVAVGYIGTDDTWYGIHALMNELPPVTGNEGCMVIVVEPDIVSALVEETWSRDEGCVDVEALTEAVSSWVRTGNSLNASGLLTRALEDLRADCETTGLKVVLVTIDDRPVHGRGPWRPSHRWSDARVRSTCGDAGRYWTHARYLVAWDQVAMLKDERHGRPGRLTWRRLGPELSSLSVLDDEHGDIDFETGLEPEPSPWSSTSRRC